MMYHSPEYTCCLLVCLLPARIIATLSPGFCSRSNNIWKKSTDGGKLGDNSEFSLRLPLESKERDRCLQRDSEEAPEWLWGPLSRADPGRCSPRLAEVSQWRGKLGVSGHFLGCPLFPGENKTCSSKLGCNAGTKAYCIAHCKGTGHCPNKHCACLSTT